MKFIETEIKGAWLIQLIAHKDDRGYFAESWSAKHFEKAGLPIQFKQGNISFNHKKGTLRGLHYQLAPFSEKKLVRVGRGSIYDVMVDLRPDSPTFKKWQAFTLKEADFQAVLIPEGCAHGYQTLEDSTEVLYEVSELYNPEAARGVAWDDPSFEIEWPLDKPLLSARDQNHPHFKLSKA